ncbi:threonylcarbamoyladenosine tRNA methylthiotransferase MtaB [Fodinibius roseus]|uniref:Threonylcarbamoyladenosine tRNA methylthiotransferase MtaB n=1 Tax=Fodinibius roseus TaxID=1194090 RepID=A0A1M4SLX9_9BACT|nr:tRNA (N(6)-L-threonylcarbamoyladenosine(37)-C(2))-methylthiotransferase MtaB [Fodinibius roseus]SHE33179.1 threonylcarbamoyladenosine tRNA methylthiotransferase MtaB [Fodinibius roseus]
MKKVAFKTLGCKLNYSETMTIRKDFEEEGYDVIEFDSQADIYVINTCSVTQGANSTCRKTVRRALRRNPEAFVAVIGCYAQLEPGEIAQIDGVDAILGAENKFRLLELFDDFHKRSEPMVYHSDVNEAVDFHNAFSADDRTRAFLKVQDGCSYNCSFCTIPMARGESRSPRISSVVRNAEQLVEDGFKEIVVTGVNAGDFGRGTDENFFMLLRALDRVGGLERIRFSSVEPNLMHEELIRFTAGSGKIQPHFHMPLQSGSDEMLGLMRRRYQSELYRQRVELIKELMPEAAIGVDVITGHPGETDERFRESYDFVDSLPVSYLHVFTYSERPGTHALEIEPNVQDSVRKERTHKFRRLSEKKRFEFDSSFCGEVREVLFEGADHNGAMLGWTDNYVRVGIPYDPRHENKILPVQLGARSKEGYLIGELTPEAKREQRVIAELVG